MITPIFRIFDSEKAYAFYVDFLGFQVDWEHRFADNMPLYVQVSMDDAAIHLSEHYGDASPGGAVRVKKSDLESYHALLHSKDYPFSNPKVEKKPWGTIEMTVVDPFSNRIIFYEGVEE
ncbi:glyoxalase superfamily protein [Alkalihalobacillus sp. CinArs1]|uniref:glyoxalase superfamily protein n=1 Tax=Alkalihalobacillus sp. CinArs1 TaxID=2995314 RepID=UPI0022DCFC34|nr:glyoxalase superfamily protein [Alkalihalobacillus sp. CinArs1]